MPDKIVTDFSHLYLKQYYFRSKHVYIHCIYILLFSFREEKHVCLIIIKGCWRIFSRKVSPKINFGHFTTGKFTMVIMVARSLCVALIHAHSLYVISESEHKATSGTAAGRLLSILFTYRMFLFWINAVLSCGGKHAQCWIVYVQVNLMTVSL